MSRTEVLHFTPSDYLADYKTKRLDLQEHGAYMLLLWHMWNDADDQSSFPLDYRALGGIWGVCPEEAERILDSLLEGKVSLLKTKTRRSETYLVSRRLHEQKIAAISVSRRQSEKGIRSGAVRREKAANRGSTTVQPQLNRNEPSSPRTTRPTRPTRSDETPVSSMSSRVQGSGRGSYPQADPEPVIAYFTDKVHPRPLTDDETRSIKRWVRVYGPDEARVQIGYAFQDGYGTNLKRIGGALKAAAARTEGRS